MNLSIRRFVPLAAILFACLCVGCSGGTAIVGPPPPPPAGNFSNSSLKGQYAFLMTGTELCAGFSSFFTRAGSFTADGNGHITGGLEDVNVCTGVFPLRFTNSSYSISADGRGTLSLTNSTGTTSYSITLTSATQGVIAQTDVNSTATGSFQRQNAAAFSNAAISGGYVFDFAGINARLNPQSVIGRFTANGGGGINTGLFDSNEAGTASNQQLFPAGAFYQIDTNGDGTNFGRGTANIAGHNFAFYIVDATRLKLLGTDLSAAAFSGEAFAQQNILFTAASLNSGFAFLLGGSSSTGPIATAGRFTADGAGNLSAIFLDENNNGALTLLPSQGGTVTGTYTVDGNGLGGGTATWTDTKVGMFTFIFYLISPTQAVFQETDSKITSDGTFHAQTAGPISAAGLAGNFAFVWSGVSTDEEDFVGQLKLTSASGNNASGIMDFNEFGAGKQFFNIQFSGPLTITAPGTGPNTLTLTTTFPSPRTFNFTAYAVDSNTVFLVGAETNQTNHISVIAGSLSRQP
jgi:hypothetical protein